jgi:hypothetical protein
MTQLNLGSSRLTVAPPVYANNDFYVKEAGGVGQKISQICVTTFVNVPK